MNLILQKKYRIYRSVMATFEGWEAPPNGLNIGDVITLMSIENDKNVVVKTRDGEFWYIRYTSWIFLILIGKSRANWRWRKFQKLPAGRVFPVLTLQILSR